MKILKLTQGSPEWHAHRASSWNASEAAMMLGVSPYLTRSQFLRWRATGIAPERSQAVLALFAEGHRTEALARPLAEKIIGDELYPCVGVIEGTKYSASLDGVTLDGTTLFEHKLLNDDLRALVEQGTFDGPHLPECYRVQMEQQIMVSGAERVLFMASKWDDDGTLIEEHHCWYRSDPELRARIVAGWEQFERDRAAYTPEPTAAPAPVGRAPSTLPALRVEAQGMVTYSNLAEFRSHAMAVLGRINRNLVTDDDFADAEQTVKWCRGVEDRLDTAKAAVLAQIQSVDEVCWTIDDIAAETRRVRLELDRLVKAEKERRRSEIVAAGVDAVRAHYATINATLGDHAIQPPQSLSLDIGGAIKGLKTLASIRDAVDAAVANAKIAASQRAERVRACVAVLSQASVGHESLFPDRVALCAEKTPEDLRNLIAARIAEHEKREAQRIEHEEAERLTRSQDTRGDEASAAATTAVGPAHIPPRKACAAPAPANIKLGDINALIAPLRIDAEGLAKLGFVPVGHERAAKLYDATDLVRMLEAMDRVILRAAREISGDAVGRAA